MTAYRRARVEGASYFFTVTLADRGSQILTKQIEDFRNAVRRTQAAHPFTIDAVVVLPDHLHTIWTMPEGDADYGLRWNLIKQTFSRTVPRGEARSPSRVKRGERGIWQRRFWEHMIRDESDYANHVTYIHLNPVKHGYVTRPVDWSHSSIHRHLKHGWCEPSWAEQPMVSEVVRAMEFE